MVKDKYKGKYSSRKEAYEAELNRLVAEGTFRAFTDEENIYMAKHMNEGMEDFIWQRRNNQFFAGKELSKIVLNA